jgi:hypothetical protein
MTRNPRRLIAVAAVSLLTAAGLTTTAASPATAAAPAPKDYGTGAAWNADPIHKQKAADPGPIVPGANAGGVGTPMEGIPVPTLDYASTAAYNKAHLASTDPAMKGRGVHPVGVPPVVNRPSAAKLAGPCSGVSGDYCFWYSVGQDAGTAIISHYWTQRVAKPGVGVAGGTTGHSGAEGVIYKTSNGDFVGGGTMVGIPWCGSTSAAPCIFVERRDDNTFKTGWTNGAGCNPCMGTSVTSWVGTSKIFGLERINGYWWFAANNQWVAAVPTSAWTSPFLTQGDMGQEYFEIGENTTLTPDTDMGDGQRPSCTGTLAGSYFINGTYNGSTPIDWDVVTNNAAGGGAINTTAWNTCRMTTQTNYFRGGGPGY